MAVKKFLFLVVIMIFACLAPVLAQGTVENITSMLGGIKSYDYDQSRQLLSDLDDSLKTVLESPEQLLLVEQAMDEFLNGDATFAAKQFVCKKLSIIGTEKSVPVLVKLLKDPATADIALYALERIPGNGVNDALRGAMKKSIDQVKIGIINTLGQRRDESAVKDLKKALNDKNDQVVKAAAAALGKIGGKSAAEALESAVGKANDGLQYTIIDAWLKCADHMPDQKQATDIYNKVYNSDYASTVRVAALRGLVKNAGNDAVPVLVSALKTDDPAIHTAAAALVRDLPKGADCAPLLALFPGLSDDMQVQFISAFSDRRETSARTAVVKAVNSENEQVRIAALTALAYIGNADDIQLLAKTAAETKGDVQQAARQSLDRLTSGNVDQKLVSAIPNADTAVKAELVQAAGNRNIKTAASMLMKTAQDPDRSVRRESYKSLAIVAAANDLPAIIDLVTSEENNTVRQEGIKTLVAVAQKRQKDQGEPIRAALAKATTIEAKGALMQALGTLGDVKALPVLQAMLKDPETELQKAAIRALSEWTDDAPAKDLMNVVQTTDNPTLKILALRGYLDLLKLESDRGNDETVRLYVEAMKQATEINEKRMVLSGLSQVPTMGALTTVAGFLQDDQLEKEAEVAVIRIVMRLQEPDKSVVKDILQTVLDKTSSDRTRNFVKDYLEKMN